MVITNISKPFAKRMYIFAFVMLLIPVIALIGWLSIAMIASGTPRPRMVTLRLDILVGMIVAVFLYFKWPWVAPIVGWVTMGMVIAHVLPWEESGVENFFYQFGFDLLFFIGANIGFIATIVGRQRPRTAT